MYLPEDKSNLLEEIITASPYLSLGEKLSMCHLNSEERKLKLGHVPLWNFEDPWVHIKGNSQPCHELTVIALGAKFVPSPCLDCYKVVIRPQTVRQLIALLELMEELQYPSKCGLEERDYVFGNYGGYFYTRSLEDGQARAREVQPLIYEQVGRVPIYPKRFCTEFELELCPGNSADYKQNDGNKKLEKKFFRRMDMTYTGKEQPDDLKELLVARWIRKAYSYGDLTSLVFNEGQPLSKQCQIYEF